MGFRAIGRLRRLVRGRRPEDRFTARAAGEEGFSLVETVMALGLIFTVMLGLLASLSTGIRGLSTGRQRTGGTAVAKEVVEQARAAAYDRVGHNLSNEDPLNDDPAITGTAPDYMYTPEGGSAEPLVGSANALYGSAGGPHPDGHRWETTRDGVDYTVRVYVTDVATELGDGYKRLTVDVEWSNPEYDEASVANNIRVSTFVSRFGVVSTGDASGIVDVESGSVRITGTLEGIDLAQAQFFFPLAHADVDADLVAETRGLAQSARSAVTLNTGTASGCGQSGTSVSCDGVKAETAADNDGGSPLPTPNQVVGPLSGASSTVSAGTALSMGTGATTSVASKSSGASCVTGCSPSVGDGDGLPYAFNEGESPSSMAADFSAGILTGKLVNVGSGGVATATIDQDTVSGKPFVDSLAELDVPAIDFLTLDLAPVGYTSAVHIDPVHVTAHAQAGETAGEPDVSGNAVQVTVYDTGLLGLAEYRTFSFSPGEPVNESAAVTFDVTSSLLGLTNTVSVETTVTAASESTSREPQIGGPITKAQANASNWFIVRTHVTITELGVTVADLTFELDYGRLGTLAQVGGS